MRCLRLQISPRVTARLLGFLVNPSLLLYGTGGVAYGRVEQSVPGASVKTPGVGWAACGRPMGVYSAMEHWRRIPSH